MICWGGWKGRQSRNAPNPLLLIETSCCSPTLITCTSEFDLADPRKTKGMSPPVTRNLRTALSLSHAWGKSLPKCLCEFPLTCFARTFNYIQMLLNYYSILEARGINPVKNLLCKSLFPSAAKWCGPRPQKCSCYLTYHTQVEEVRKNFSFIFSVMMWTTQASYSPV